MSSSVEAHVFPVEEERSNRAAEAEETALCVSTRQTESFRGAAGTVLPRYTPPTCSPFLKSPRLERLLLR